MQEKLPERADEFCGLYRRVEHLLRRNGYLRQDRDKAEVNWRKFAKDLGGTFFDQVQKSEQARTLIAEPPRAYHRDDGWLPENQIPIDDVEQLFLRGVCQVRNNIVHGEKFILEESERSYALVEEAWWVLNEATKRHPEAERVFKEL